MPLTPPEAPHGVLRFLDPIELEPPPIDEQATRPCFTTLTYEGTVEDVLTFQRSLLVGFTLDGREAATSFHALRQLMERSTKVLVTVCVMVEGD